MSQPSTPGNFFHANCFVCVRASVAVAIPVKSEHALGRVRVHFYVRVIVRDLVHDFVRCGVRVGDRPDSHNRGMVD